LGQRVQSTGRTGESDKLTELKQLILALSAFSKTKNKPYQPLEIQQMNTLKRIWQALNTDITPHLQAIRDNILDIYDPQLVPVHSGGVTIEWVSARTGERLW
jgi:hypothetical protein